MSMILYWFRSLSTVWSSTENRRIQGLFKAFEWFSSTFKSDLIFMDFSRKPSKFKTFQACANPVYSWERYNVHFRLKMSLLWIILLFPHPCWRLLQFNLTHISLASFLSHVGCWACWQIVQTQTRHLKMRHLIRPSLFACRMCYLNKNENTTNIP